MMAAEDNEPPLIIFDDVNDDVNDQSANLSSGQDPSPNSVCMSEEIDSRVTVSVCGGGGSQGYMELNSSGHGEASGSSESMAEQGKAFDSNCMEDMIQKILEKYGEAEEQGDGVVTSGRTTTTSQDAVKETGGTKREADSSVSDMIQRESSKWDRVYGTEDNHGSPSTRDWTGRQKIGGRRPVTSTTEDMFSGHVEIGSVIRSQTGVAKQLISVSEGLDEVNDDLEEMKRELKRIQTKAYTCLEGGDLTDVQTKQTAPIGGLKVADIYRRKNEWVEEREGIVKFDDGSSVQETDRYGNTLQAPGSYLPGVGRTHIKESDINVAHLLTIAEPVDPYRRTRSLVDDGTVPVKREGRFNVDRFGRPVTQSISVDESSSKRDGDRWRVGGGHRKHDGYCYMCEEFDDIHVGSERRSMSTYDEPSKVVQRSHNHTYKSMNTYEEPSLVVHRSHQHRYQSVPPSYFEPSKVVESSHNNTYKSTNTYDEPPLVFHRSHEQRYQSVPPSYDEPSKVVHNQTYKSMPTYEEPSLVVHRSHEHRYQSVPPSYEESSSVIQRDHTYRPLSVADLDLNSHHRSREDFGGICKTSSGIYFYSDDVRGYPDEVIQYPDGVTRSVIRQPSIPRVYQSPSQSVAAVPRSPSQTRRRPSVGFTSKFLAKVRRRNSLGGRIDTDGYRSQTLKGY